MLSFIVRRLLLLLPNLVLLTFVMFAAMTSWFGSPSTMMLGRDAAPEAVADMDRRFGFDRPIAEQYARWIGSAATGDLGRSFATQQSVSAMLAPAIPVTVELSLAAILLAFVGSVGVNSLAVGRRIIAPVVTAASIMGVTVPNFMLGASFVYVFAIRLRWLPTTGWVPWSEGVVPHALHLLMPVLTLCAFYASAFSMVYRSEYRSTAGQLFVRVAAAKGLSETRVSFRHILPNAVLPVITQAGLSLGQLIGGAVVTETVFSIPGVGRLLVSAIGSSDYPVILAVTMLILSSVALANLLADLLYARVNPLVRM
jgi:peptide/nickel transport system permease protein